MRALIIFLVSSTAMACPQGPPPGFVPTPRAAGRAYNNREKTIQVVITCEKSKTSDAVRDAMRFLGDVSVEGSVARVDVVKNQIRFFVTTNDDEVVQAAVVARTPAALQRASPALAEYLKK